jgi:hypothetical protein
MGAFRCQPLPVLLESVHTRIFSLDAQAQFFLLILMAFSSAFHIVLSGETAQIVLALFVCELLLLLVLGRRRRQVFVGDFVLNLFGPGLLELTSLTEQKMTKVVVSRCGSTISNCANMILTKIRLENKLERRLRHASSAACQTSLCAVLRLPICAPPTELPEPSPPFV